MKARYKITTAFLLLTVVVLAAVCAFVYYYTAAQREKDFTKRLRNRAATVASFLFKLPEKDFRLLSKLDSATSSLLAFENISIYNNRNQRIYRFAKNVTGTATVNEELLNKARLEGQVNTTIGQRQSVALYYQESESPVVIVVSAVDENGILNLYDLRKSLLFALVAGILLAFLSGWFFSRQLLKPISNISKTVTSISATNIEERLPISATDDEWNQLAVTFNNLLSRLQDSFEIQGRFISNASHELSTPLTSVSNQIDVVLHKPRNNEEYLAVLQSVKADVQHMTSLTQQLLKLAQTARGGVIQTEPVRIDEILMELPSLLKKLSPHYLVTIYFDELPDNENLCTINGSYELLLSAFKNIAENGCKYATDHTVNISLSFIGNKIIALFSNKSTTINPGELVTIFQPFQRGTDTMNENGFGLGLSLTRRIILLHKGEIKAEIPEPGHFLITVILPSSW